MRSPELGALVVFDPPGYAMISYGFDIEYAGRDAFLTELWLEPESRGKMTPSSVAIPQPATLITLITLFE